MNAGSTILTLLKRPINERLFLLMPIGWPADDATVPFRAIRSSSSYSNSNSIGNEQTETETASVPLLRKKLEDIVTTYM